MHRRVRPQIEHLEHTLGFRFPPGFDGLYAALASGNAFRRSPFFQLVPLDEALSVRADLGHPDLVPVVYDRDTEATWAWRIPVAPAGVDDVGTTGQWVVHDRHTRTLTLLGPSFLNAVRAMLVDAEARAAEYDEEASLSGGAAGGDPVERAAVIRAWVAMMMREHRALPVEPPQSIPKVRHHDPFAALDDPMSLVLVGPMSDEVREEIPTFEAAIAQNHFAAGMLALARERWLRALSDAPDCVAIHWALAVAAGATGDAEEAAWHHLAVVEGDWTTAAAPVVGPESLWTANVFASLSALRRLPDRALRGLVGSAKTADLVFDPSLAEEAAAWRGVVRDLIAAGRFGRARQLALGSRARFNREDERPAHPQFAAADLLQQVYFALGLAHRVEGLRWVEEQA